MRALEADFATDFAADFAKLDAPDEPPDEARPLLAALPGELAEPPLAVRVTSQSRHAFGAGSDPVSGDGYSVATGHSVIVT